jgi:hypothetical protein
MAVFRGLMLLLLVASAVCFALYAGTGQQRFKKWGLRTLVTTIAAAFVFFAVLFVDQL